MTNLFGNDWARDAVARALDVCDAAISLLLEDADKSIDLEKLEAAPQKVAAESAILLRVVAARSGAGFRSLSDQAFELAEKLLPAARGPRQRLAIAMRPGRALELAVPHLMLRSMGISDHSFDELLAQTLQARAAGGIERAPHRALEMDWLAGLLTASEGIAPLRLRSKQIQFSALNNDLELIFGSRDESYELTHAVFYITDFGLAECILPRGRDAILANAECALIAALEADDFDVAGELLLLWPYLGAEWSPFAVFAVHLLAELEGAFGVLPSLAPRISHMHSLCADANIQTRRQYAAATAYHTAYVMGLLADICVRDGGAPRLVEGSADGASKWRCELDEGDTPPKWLEYYDQLTVRQQSAIERSIYEAALRRAARCFEPATVHKMLAERSSASGEFGFVSSQCADLLVRMAAAAGHSVTP